MTTGSDARELWRWRAEAMHEENCARRTVVVELLDEHQEQVVARWQLEGAWPTRWTGPTLDASGTEVAMEEIELAYERLDWTD